MHNSRLLDIKDPGTADKPNQYQFQIVLPKEDAFQERFRDLAWPRHSGQRAQASGPGKTEHTLPFSSDTSLSFPGAPSSVQAGFQVMVPEGEWKNRQGWCYSARKITFISVLFCPKFLEFVSYMDCVTAANQLSENKFLKGRKVNFNKRGQSMPGYNTEVDLSLPFPSESGLSSWLAFQ